MVKALLFDLVNLGLKSNGKCFLFIFFIVVSTLLASSPFPSSVVLTPNLEITFCFFFSLMIVKVLAILLLKDLILDNLATEVPVLLVNLMLCNSSYVILGMLYLIDSYF